MSRWVGRALSFDRTENLAHILAIELAASAPSSRPSRAVKPAPATAAVRDLVRTVVGGPGPDRFLAPDLAAAELLVRTGAVVAAAEAVTGHLQ